MSTTESFRQRRQSSRGASILSCTTMVIHDHEHELDDPSHVNTNQLNTRMCWLFATGSSWTLWHTGGSGQDTPGTQVPGREGRGWPDKSLKRLDQRHRRHQSYSATLFEPWNTNMVAEQRNDRMANTTLSDYNFQNEISHVVYTIEVEKPPITQEKINQVLDHIQDADKAADVSVAMQ